MFCVCIAYKKKLGLNCQFLIEPKAKEPTRHQYDYGETMLEFTLSLDVCFIISIYIQHFFVFTVTQTR